MIKDVELTRSFERDQTIYDWQHYIELIQRKPGALRNGAPFKEMPAPLLELQRQLLKHTGGDRVMAQVLGAVNLHGLEAVYLDAAVFQFEAALGLAPSICPAHSECAQRSHAQLAVPTRLPPILPQVRVSSQPPTPAPSRDHHQDV